MINNIIDLISGKVPTKEGLSLLLKQAIEQQNELYEAKFSECDKSIRLLQSQIQELTNMLDRAKTDFDNLKKQFQTLKTETQKKNKTEDVLKHDNFAKTNVKENVSSTTKMEETSKLNVKKRYFSLCSANGFSSSYALIGMVDDTHSSANYVIYDDGGTECEFEPVIGKSDSLIMNKNNMLVPVCEIDTVGKNKIEVIANGKVMRMSGNNWALVTKCKIRI